jgi:hypothetical protein
VIHPGGRIESVDGPEKRFPGRFDVRRGVFSDRDGTRIPAVVKRMPAGRWDGLRGPSRAQRCLDVAGWLESVGVPTPEPLGVESTPLESVYICRLVPDAVQIRAWFRHRYESGVPAPPLEAGFDEVVDELGRLARKMHDGGIFFRDFTDGNVLVTSESGRPKLWLIDLDRARHVKGPLGVFRRLRDLARPGLNRVRDQERFLTSYGARPLGLWLAAVVSLRARIRFWDWFKRAVRPWKW